MSYINDKHDGRVFPRLGADSSRGNADRPPEPKKGYFSGTYRCEGFTVERVTDGLCLVVCPNTRRKGPRDSDRFLVCVTEAGRLRVGNLYGHGPDLDGCEFDDDGFKGRTGPACRYVIEQTGRCRLRIRVKYVKRSRGRK